MRNGSEEESIGRVECLENNVIGGRVEDGFVRNDKHVQVKTP